jgi:hypothetical protein
MGFTVDGSARAPEMRVCIRVCVSFRRRDEENRECEHEFFSFLSIIRIFRRYHSHFLSHVVAL